MRNRQGESKARKKIKLNLYPRADTFQTMALQQWWGKDSQRSWAKYSGPKTLESIALAFQDPGIHIFNAFPDDFDTGDLQTTFCETMLLDTQGKIYILGNLNHLLSEPYK